MRALLITAVATVLLFAAGAVAVIHSGPASENRARLVIKVEPLGQPEAPPADEAAAAGDAQDEPASEENKAAAEAADPLAREPAAPPFDTAASDRLPGDRLPGDRLPGDRPPGDRPATPPGPADLYGYGRIPGLGAEKERADAAEAPQAAAEPAPPPSAAPLAEPDQADKADKPPAKPEDVAAAPPEAKEAAPPEAHAAAKDAAPPAEDKGWAAVQQPVKPSPPMPVPPLPVKRVNSKPEIPRGKTSSAPRPGDVSVATAGTELRNAVASPLLVNAAEAVGPRIAVIVRGLGANEEESQEAIAALGPGFTLAFNPYGKNLSELAAKARARGHEIFLSVPMEPMEPGSSGALPHMMLANLGADENAKRLAWVLARIEGYSGLTNLMGAKLAQTPGGIRPLMLAAKERGIPYIDDGVAAHPFALFTAAEVQLRYRVADSRIDIDPSPDAIAEELVKLEDIAFANGEAIGVATASPSTIKALAAWSATLKGKKILLVPASTLALGAAPR